MSITLTTPLLPYSLSICGIPEIPDFAARGVTHVVSILDPDWPDLEEFAVFASHWRVVYRFHDVVVAEEGRQPPGARDVETILTLGERLRAQPVEHLLVHCHAGVSRSTATAAILMAQHNPGREAEVFAEIMRIRPQSWPNSLMVALADAALDRGGALVRALAAHQVRAARISPELADLIRRAGRGQELPGEE